MHGSSKNTTTMPSKAAISRLNTGNYATAIPLLLLYNLVFILPLIIIIAIVYFGNKSKRLEKWRKENRGLMRLFIGLFLLALGGYMIWAII